MEPGEIENANFRTQHHVLRCKSNDQDTFSQARYRRKSLAQYFYASQSLCDADGICQIIERRSHLYHALVDDRTEKSVNNYADAALILSASAGKSDASKWKSNLRSSRPVLAAVSKVTDCPGKCTAIDIFEQDLKLLASAAVEESCNAKAQSNSKFVPKTAGASLLTGFLSKEQAQRRTVVDMCHQNQINTEPLSRKNSLDIVSEKRAANASCGANRWQPQQIQSSTNGRLSRFNSDEFGPGDNNSCGRKDPASTKNFPRNSYTFGMRGSNCSSSIPKCGEERTTFNNTGPRVTGGSNNMGTFGGNNFARGGYQSNYGSGWNKNSADSGSRTAQNVPEEPGISSISASIFRSARDELAIQNQKKFGGRGGSSSGSSYSVGRGGTNVQKRSLGTRRGGVRGQFVPPIKPTDEDDFGGMFGVKQPGMNEGMGGDGEEVDERLKNIDPKMIETIRNEIMDIGSPVEWDDIAGLEFAKTTIQEIVVWPLLRPDIFTGLRKPPKGLLLFGPPGTGKTLIGKCIASQSQSTFFSISASSLTSKWIGDGEKMVRALFAVAKVHQPSVVFIDEIDSLLTQRSDTEHESSRRIKTEFLVQLDGAGTGDEERILVVGATNRPQELDEAARRRLVKRLYIPLPEFPARRQIVERLMSKERSALNDAEIDDIASLTDGYSGADMKNLCQEASLGPIRSISFSAMHQITADQVRPITVDDFKNALQRVRASVSSRDLEAYVQWDKTYGMGSGM